jgi:ribosome-associated translation inhibitor RaiA
MEQPLQVTFHNLPHSDAVEADLRARVEKLEQLYGRVVGGRVVVDSPHRSAGAAKGKTYAVRIELALPGHELIVNREPVGDLKLAINDAFDTAKRRLKEFADKQRGG